MPSNHLIFCCSLFLLSSIFPSIRVFSNESDFTSDDQSNEASASLSVRPSNEYSGLISFRIDWFDILAVQGTLKNLLQYHSSKASILLHSAFFMVQLSTRKTIPLTMWTFVSKVMSLLVNTLYVCHSLYSLKKIKSVTVSIVSPFICHEVMRPNAMTLVFWMLSCS